MDIILEKIDEETWKEVGGILLEDAPKLAQRFQKLQPFLAGKLGDAFGYFSRSIK